MIKIKTKSNILLKKIKHIEIYEDRIIVDKKTPSTIQDFEYAVFQQNKTIYPIFHGGIMCVFAHGWTNSGGERYLCAYANIGQIKQ